jgi:hypothetical protein
MGPRVNAFLAGAVIGVVARMMFGADIGRAALQGGLQPVIADVADEALQGTPLAPSLTAGYVPRIAAYARTRLGSYSNGPRMLAGEPTSFGAGINT